MSIDPAVSFQAAQNYKGNILQYKKNSGNLTKNQRYAQIAKGMWTNRTTTWATQTESYTNPNTNNLKRVNATNIYVPIDNAPYSYGFLPSDCQNLFVKEEIDILVPNVELNSSPLNGSNIYTIKRLINTQAIIPTGGSLVCNVTQNPCTGEEKIVGETQKCFPTTDSDVPGPIMDLCYDDTQQTYYPKTRTTYLAGSDKWPINSKFIFAAQTCRPAPTICQPVSIPLSFNVEIIEDVAYLTWEVPVGTDTGGFDIQLNYQLESI